MNDGSIVDEVHRIREELLAEYGGDLRRLIADARARTEAAAREGHSVLSPGAVISRSGQAETRKVG